MQSLPVITSESEEEFDLSPSNVVAGVKISNTLDILEEILDFHSDPFAPLDLDLPANSCRITCTKIQNFEEEAESSTQSIWMEESLLVVTPSLDALEVYEIYVISYPHMS